LKQWLKQAVVCAPIDLVWELADGSVEQLQRIFPAMITFSLINKTNDAEASAYRVAYKHKKQVKECDIQLLDYANRSAYKVVKVLFEYKRRYEITIEFQLYRVDDHRTNARFTVTKIALNWWAKCILKFATDRAIRDLTERVKQAFAADNLSETDEADINKSS